MKNIIKSASKISLLSLTSVLAIAFLFGSLTGKIEGAVVADIFKISIGAIFGFYFAHKGDEDQLYLGK